MDSEHTWSTDFARGLLEGAGYRSTIIPASAPFWSQLRIYTPGKFVDAKIANDRVRSADIRELLDNPSMIGQMRVKQDAGPEPEQEPKRVFSVVRPKFGPKSKQGKDISSHVAAYQ